MFYNIPQKSLNKKILKKLLVLCMFALCAFNFSACASYTYAPQSTTAEHFDTRGIFHTVQSGESLSRIARRFYGTEGIGEGIASIMKENSWLYKRSGLNVRTGDVLYIPLMWIEPQPIVETVSMQNEPLPTMRKTPHIDNDVQNSYGPFFWIYMALLFTISIILAFMTGRRRSYSSSHEVISEYRCHSGPCHHHHKHHHTHGRHDGHGEGHGSGGH